MTHFYKVSGSGNDFLALAEPFAVPSRETIRAWCRRGVSLGADGLFVLRRTEGGAAMDYFNADGLPADLCLNGTRCAAQLAFHLGWAAGAVQVRTAAGSFDARWLDASRVAVELPAPTEPPRAVEVQAAGSTYAGYCLLVGVPHFVLSWPEGLERVPVNELGREIRRHPAFGPPGTNVDFVSFTAPDWMEIRTYERGVEAETLSCGTGAVASALAVRYWAGEGAPDEWIVQVPGGVVGVRMVTEPDGEHVQLAGPAELVFDGVLSLA